MKDHIAERVNRVAEIFASAKYTVREVAEKEGCSKSTVHKDLRERLPKLDSETYQIVSKVLEMNKAERHIRGGIATKAMYDRRRGIE